MQISKHETKEGINASPLFSDIFMLFVGIWVNNTLSVVHHLIYTTYFEVHSRTLLEYFLSLKTHEPPQFIM